jgi:hypothetical protein
MVLPQTTLDQISIAPGHTDPHPGKKERKNNLNKKQLQQQQKKICSKEGRVP